MSTNERPLSPHLQIYRWQWTMALSILHRVTGVGLAVGTLLLVGWLISMAEGPDRYAAYQSFMDHWFGRLLLFGWTWALFYHLCNGMRHLIWDTGRGLELDTAAASGYVVGGASILLTGIAWFAAYSNLGLM
ncbi:MAG: Succinate dehydrogenase cytochrome b556 subunit [Alphaproteobacteria bacterium MarineAlpha4_Bin2]|nr:MAG: Succinate dehydrogenase cytochrome b556 subunit [Alphaproteobacteria bacterium MarineAlpha4_Bin2]